MPVFFIDSTQVRESAITIDDPLFTHLCKSLRLRINDRLDLRDQHRRHYHAQVTHIGPRSLIAEIRDVQTAPYSNRPPVTLAQSILKGEKMSWVIQKATELGVSQIVPLVTDRVIGSSLRAQGAQQQERWKRIALEAAQQSERWEIPIIATPQEFREFCATREGSEHVLMFTARRRGQPLQTQSLLPPGKRALTVVIGPEGGWSSAEEHVGKERGFQEITLGKGILRSETASLVALAILQFVLGTFD